VSLICIAEYAPNSKKSGAEVLPVHVPSIPVGPSDRLKSDWMRKKLPGKVSLAN
jgi:hypothetical protein